MLKKIYLLAGKLIQKREKYLLRPAQDLLTLAEHLSQVIVDAVTIIEVGVDVFIDKLRFRSYDCSLNGNPPYKICHNYVNLYVSVCDNCNADCSFCVFKKKKNTIKPDFEKFKTILDELVGNGVAIHKISFTGGEPTTKTEVLDEYLSIVNKLRHKPFVVVNSNGYNLKWLHDNDIIDNISLSYHHYDSVSRYKLAKTESIVSDEDIKKYGKKVHLTCNLIRGFIDSEESIIKYLEKAASMNVHDVGLVSLMKVNTFCMENHIDFDSINFKSQNVVCNKVWSCLDICKCKNYLYLPSVGNKVVKFYSRYRCKHTVASNSNYVYDGNHLRTNFNGEVII